ncbi:MAG: shikimate kinase [Saprospiraceae bacterium]
MRIFLTGFMGSGKTHVGRRLAARIGLPFVDLDEWIEEMTGMTITEIFDRHGTDYFRELETRYLRDFDSLKRVVIACGGGTPIHHDNMAWMNTHGITIYLDVETKELVKRLANQTRHRPLLTKQKDLAAYIKRTKAERADTYLMAKMHLSLDGQNLDVAQIIADRLNLTEYQTDGDS